MSGGAFNPARAFGPAAQPGARAKVDDLRSRSTLPQVCQAPRGRVVFDGHWWAVYKATHIYLDPIMLARPSRLGASAHCKSSASGATGALHFFPPFQSRARMSSPLPPLFTHWWQAIVGFGLLHPLAHSLAHSHPHTPPPLAPCPNGPGVPGAMWLYWVGDFAGAAAAAILQKMFTTAHRAPLPCVLGRRHPTVPVVTSPFHPSFHAVCHPIFLAPNQS